MVAMGAQVPVQEVARRLQVPLAKDGDDVLTAPVGPQTPPPDSYIAANAATGPRRDIGTRLLRTGEARYADAKGRDLAAFTDRLATIEKITDPVLRRAALNKFAADVPALLRRSNARPGNATVMADTMSAGLFNDLISAAADTHGATAANSNSNHQPPGSASGGQFAPRANSIDDVLNHARQDKSRDVFHDYETINSQAAAAIQQRSGMDVGGYKRTLTSSAVNHTLARHAADPRPIVEDDFRQLSARLAQPVSQVLEKQAGKMDRLVSEVRDASGHIVIVEEQRTGRGKLALVSMYRP